MVQTLSQSLASDTRIEDQYGDLDKKLKTGEEVESPTRYLVCSLRGLNSKGRPKPVPHRVVLCSILLLTPTHQKGDRREYVSDGRK